MVSQISCTLLTHHRQEQSHPQCEQGVITQPVRVQELHTSPSYPDPLTTPQVQPLPSTRSALSNSWSGWSPFSSSYTPLFPQKKSSPFPSCPQVQQCSQHWIFPVTDRNHLFLLTVLSSNFVFFLTVPALMLELYRCEHSGKNKFYTQTLKYLQATHFQPSSHPSANNMCKYTVPNSRCCGHIRGKCSIASWCTQWVATTWIANSLKELFN